MEELYIETPDGRFRLDEKLIQKYRLKKGRFSPFTHSRIINKDGEFFIEENDRKNTPHYDEETITFTTSESIDIAKGVDS